MDGSDMVERLKILTERFDNEGITCAETLRAFRECVEELKRYREAVEHYIFELEMIDAESWHKKSYPKAKKFIEYLADRSKKALKIGDEILKGEKG